MRLSSSLYRHKTVRLCITGSNETTKGLLDEYKTLDCDFGLDQDALETLLKNKAFAAQVVSKFQYRDTGIVNALSVVCSFGLCSSGTPGQKLGFLFDAFDFDATGTISFDELTIMFASTLRGLRIVSGLGTADPDPAHLEIFAKAAFSDAGKNTDDCITKDNFVDWATKDLIPRETDSVTLIDVMLKYGVIQSPPEMLLTKSKRSRLLLL